MICPHCNYTPKKKVNGKNVLKEEGRFYMPPGNSMQLGRTANNNFHHDNGCIVGCPSCHKLFMDIE